MCMRCSLNCPVNAISIGLLEPFKVIGKYNFLEIFSHSYSVICLIEHNNTIIKIKIKNIKIPNIMRILPRKTHLFFIVDTNNKSPPYKVFFLIFNFEP